jgi:hypothetical protein
MTRKVKLSLIREYVVRDEGGVHSVRAEMSSEDRMTVFQGSKEDCISFINDVTAKPEPKTMK